MKVLKFSLAILIALVFVSTSVFSQVGEWEMISPEREEFSVKLPKNAEIAPPTDLDDKDRKGYYKAVVGNTYYLIRSTKGKTWWLSDAVLKYADKHNAKKKTFSSVNVKGDKYKFKDADGFYNTVIKVSTKNKHYLFHTATLSKKNPDVNSFIDSIVIKENADADEPKENSEKVEKINSNGGDVNAGGGTGGGRAGSGSGSARGSGSGVGSGFGDGYFRRNEKKYGSARPMPKKNGQTSGLKILSKTKPGYTDLARLYNITGSVRVKIIFLKNGQIGDVTPVKRLPFGLTTQAIKAARRIRFTPAMKNGETYSVAKHAVFQFKIY